ncbi:MAG: ImmA/IrrE family metallo-endopeptidase [Dactylosporangium sp.]|nr:ImmA/IrrE family metallo-endopeptidase [Dactylosporangium sp.]
MSMPLWVTELADVFWSMAGGPEEPARDLRGPIANALPVTVVMLPRLRVTTVDAWLQHHGIYCTVDVQDRPLRACLVARNGHGVVILEGTDPPDEQRFSLAHELAHFLRHYWQPRTDIAGRLGPSVLEVLDGDRAPVPDERVFALLARVRLGFFTHFMARAGETRPIDAAEREANLLAYELLAPSAAVMGTVATVPPAERRGVIVELLTTMYGLPATVARRYAAFLCPESSPSGSFLRRLGLGGVELSNAQGERRVRDRRVGGEQC